MIWAIYRKGRTKINTSFSFGLRTGWGQGCHDWNQQLGWGETEVAENAALVSLCKKMFPKTFLLALCCFSALLMNALTFFFSISSASHSHRWHNRKFNFLLGRRLKSNFQLRIPLKSNFQLGSHCENQFSTKKTFEKPFSSGKTFWKQFQKRSESDSQSIGVKRTSRRPGVRFSDEKKHWLSLRWTPSDG